MCFNCSIFPEDATFICPYCNPNTSDCNDPSELDLPVDYINDEDDYEYTGEDA